MGETPSTTAKIHHRSINKNESAGSSDRLYRLWRGFLDSLVAYPDGLPHRYRRFGVPALRQLKDAFPRLACNRSSDVGYILGTFHRYEVLRCGVHLVMDSRALLRRQLRQDVNPRI